MKNISSASHIKTNEKVLDLIKIYFKQGNKLLDLGCGKGYLSRKVGDFIHNQGFNAKKYLLASDIEKNAFEAFEIPFKQLNFDKKMPFKNKSFDLIYSVEVIEHLNSPYDLILECSRILKPGGYLILSTPNILHLGSRFKYFKSGFFDLFEPPSIHMKNRGRLCGHIMPLHMAYYSYALRLHGFSNIQLFSDKSKSFSIFLYAILFPWLKLNYCLEKKRIEKYDLGVYKENKTTLKYMYSFIGLTSRSLIFVAQKK